MIWFTKVAERLMDSTPSNPPTFVVDASVAVKWHLEDEQDTPEAIRLLTDFRDGRVLLLAPDHIRFEVPSAIRNALRVGRLNAAEGLTAIESFLGWRIETVGNDALIEAGYEMALRFGCSFYDGLYLALAENAGRPLVYADNRLRNALGGRFPLAMWVSDYRFLG